MSTLDFNKLDGLKDIELKVPQIARGEVLPYQIERMLSDNEKQIDDKKADRRHNWTVSLVSTLIGAVVGGLIGYFVAIITATA